MILRHWRRGAAVVSVAFLVSCASAEDLDPNDFPDADTNEDPDPDDPGDTDSPPGDTDSPPGDTGDPGGPVDEPDNPPASADNPAGSEAAALRARLTSLFVEHGYLVGIASKTAREGGDGGEALQSLDANTAALGAEIAAMYGQSVGAQFAAAWRTMTRHELAYSAARAAGDSAAEASAEAGAFAAAQQTVEIVDAANDRLDPAWLGEWVELLVVDMLLLLDIEETAVTSQYDRYSWTLRKTKVIGQILSAAYDAQDPDRLPGDPDLGGAELRAHIGWLLVDSTYQTSLLTWAESGVGDAFAARKYIDEQSTARLVQTLEDAYGAGSAGAFEAAWNAQIDSIRVYSSRVAQGADASDAEVEAAEQRVVSALTDLVPTIDAARLREALSARNDALLAAADAQVAGSSWTDDARGARVAALTVGDLVAVGLYEHRPDYEAPSYGP